ncbi:MAG: hypothetical protein JW904_02670 [Spirochaetales bacterium]|nr:hypothetical protein [Spirochaetales bacterium]
MKYPALVMLLFILIPFLCCGQQHLSLSIDDPFYYLMEIAEIKSDQGFLPAAKPYSIARSLSFLDTMNNSTAFSINEKTIIRSMISRLTNKTIGAHETNVSASGPMGMFYTGIWFESLLQANFNDVSAWHMSNALRFYLKGDISDFLSYYGAVGITYDKVGPTSFVPYGFTKEWDGFHANAGTPRYSADGIEPYPYFSFILEDEITAEFFDKNLLMSFSRFRRDWSIGDGDLLLSKTARPFQGVDIQARLAPWVQFSYTLGSLSDWQREETYDPLDPENPSFQKMLTVQMFEFFPFSWLYLSTGAAAVWGRRFDLGYMNPVMYPVLHQNIGGNHDNVMLNVRCAAVIPGWAKIYGSFFADEMDLEDPGRFFSSPRNMMAMQAGIKVPVPGVPFTLVTIQYTKIEPFVYAHYPEAGVSTTEGYLDVSYTNDGENLGYRLQPNSDELLVKIESLFTPEWHFLFSYQLIRHGTNDAALLAGAPAIYGDINEYFDYNQIGLYPEKNFLEDGYYDWNNIFSLQTSYRFSGFPAIITLFYNFSVTVWDMNSTGVSSIAAEFRNIVGIKLKLFY